MIYRDAEVSAHTQRKRTCGEAAADARAVLAQIESGALDALPPAVRDGLRIDAERALRDPVLAFVVEVRPARRSSGRTVVVACPICRKRHIHRWPLRDAAPGWRGAHCIRGRSYYIPGPRERAAT